MNVYFSHCKYQMNLDITCWKVYVNLNSNPLKRPRVGDLYVRLRSAELEEAN